MSGEIVFYYNPRSHAQMMRWMPEDAEAPYRIVPVDLAKNDQKEPSFLAINPARPAYQRSMEA